MTASIDAQLAKEGLPSQAGQAMGMSGQALTPEMWLPQAGQQVADMMPPEPALANPAEPVQY